MKVRKLLLFVLLPSLAWTFSPPQIISDSTIQSDDVIGDFIELNEGDDISLQCTHSQGEDTEFVLPDLTEYKLFDPSDYALRRQGGGSDWSNTLLIKNAKVTDTGLYACVVRNEHSLAHHVYVFVKGLKLFIPLDAGGFSVDPYNYAVPCKTSRNVPRTSIKLSVNGDDWKIASKKYDPRFGFNITGKTAEEHKLSTQLMFICTFTDTNETIEFILSPRAGNINPKVDVEWGEISPWAHVGGDMAVECILKLYLKDDKYKHKLNITCPRCDNKEAVQSLTRARTRGMSHSISIHEVVNEDRGVYKCQWYYDGKLEKVIEKTLEVSPKKGQIKINEVSSQEIRIRNNKSFSLQVNMTAYPLNLPGFTAKWMRHYIKPPKDAPITETIITDEKHHQESKRFENQVSETLTVKDAKTNSSGLYVLSIEILDTVKTVEFKVIVLSDELKPKIQITTPSSYALFNQSYYPPNSQIGVLCSAESLPLPYYVRLSYRNVNQGWQLVEPGSMNYHNGTYESAIQWDTVLKQTMDVKCEASSGSNKLELVRIKVADGAPEVSHSITKSPSATPLEDEKDIYEGDTILLNCQYPTDADMKAKWKFNGNDIAVSKTNVTETDISTTLNAVLKNISSSQGGDYTCELSNNNEQKVLQLKLEVLKTLKPYFTDSDSEAPIELEYGKDGYLHCYLEGLPKPQIYWFKDGRPYTQGVLEDQNRTLHITRVALEDKGKFKCRAENRAGYAEASFHTNVSGGPKKLGSGWISLMVIVLLLLCCCVVAFAFVIWRQRKTNKEQNRALEVLYEQLMRETSGPPPSTKQPLDQRVSDLPYNREFELERDMLDIGNRLGAGQFGIVWKGVLKKNRVSDKCVEEERLEVAVKGPLNGKNATHQKMLADELKIMCAIGKHPNVLALVGAVTKNMKNGELFVIVELCENGNLKEFLLARKANFMDELRPFNSNQSDYVEPDSAKRSRYANELDTQWAEDAEKDRLLPDSLSLTTSDLLSFAMQVANGMDYLSAIPCIHRDLAARNVLITSNNICRIADFGMARNENKDYYKLRKSKNVPVPYRWMSIEAIEQGLFTVESDVWSFGILLFEIFTLAGLPYPTIANEDLLGILKNGCRNSKPNYCHDEIYKLMLLCWDEDNLKRPSFNHCVLLLKKHLELSSPQLLERVEKGIMKDVNRQNSLSKWISLDIDYREQARNALAKQEASRAANTENLYLRNF